MFVIIGATGKVGRATIGALRRQGAPVRAVVRTAANAGELAAAGCELAVADLADGAAVRAAIEGAAAVQVICPVGPQGDDLAWAGIIDGITEALIAQPPPAILAISDYGAERASGTGITLTFHRLEQQLGRVAQARRDLSLTLLRSAEHMQNWSRLIRGAVQTGMLPSLHHPLTKRFPTVSAGDVGLAAADLLIAPAAPGTVRVVNIEGPRRYRAQDVAEAAAAIAGRAVTARELARDDWPAALAKAGLSPRYIALVTALYDAHNGGLIDAEPGAEIRRGGTELAEVLADLLRS